MMNICRKYNKYRSTSDIISSRHFILNHTIQSHFFSTSTTNQQQHQQPPQSSIWSLIKDSFNKLFNINQQQLSQHQTKRKRKQKIRDGIPTNLYQATITSYDDEFRGVAHLDTISNSNEKSKRLQENRPVHIFNAMIGEKVDIQVFQRTKTCYNARTKNIIDPPSSLRIDPLCKHYTLCNGCSMMHMDIKTQQQLKIDYYKNLYHQSGLVESMEQVSLLDIPNQQDGIGYRRRARLRGHYNQKINRVEVGFTSPLMPSFQIDHCPILVKELQWLPKALSDLFTDLSIKDKIPAIEITLADNITSIVIRCLKPPNEEDRVKIKEFAIQHNLLLLLQHGGPDSYEQIYPDHHVDMKYSPVEGITLNASPVDFIQINSNANQIMVEKVLEYLNLNENDNCYDLFCGVGNFTIPMGKKAGSVIGFEHSQELLSKLMKNVHLNDMNEKVKSVSCDLFKDVPSFKDVENSEECDEEQHHQEKYKLKINKLVIDPPRSGAQAVCSSIPRGLDSIVYVSCNPNGSFVTDLHSLLTNYTVKEIKLIDMFAQTSKMEAIAYLVPK